MLNASVDIVT